MMQEKCLRSSKTDMDINRYRIIMTKSANKDLKNIYNYISKNLLNPIVAIKLIKRIKETILNLEFFPYSWVKIKIKPYDKQYHRLIIRKYIVLYTIDEKYKLVYIHKIINQRNNYLKSQ